jgi:hypothetical protein
VTTDSAHAESESSMSSGRTMTTSRSLSASASPRAKEPKTITSSGPISQCSRSYSEPAIKRWILKAIVIVMGHRLTNALVVVFHRISRQYGLHPGTELIECRTQAIIISRSFRYPCFGLGRTGARLYR